jgi:hypothetical protein
MTASPKTSIGYKYENVVDNSVGYFYADNDEEALRIMRAHAGDGFDKVVEPFEVEWTLRRDGVVIGSGVSTVEVSR